MSNRFTDQLKGGDLRSIGKSNTIVKQIDNQLTFDELFACIFNSERIIAMRGIDAVEKVTVSHPEYLAPHKKSLLNILHSAENKEIKWHLALLVSRLNLTKSEMGKVWQTLSNWSLDKKESKIVRVNSIQGLFDLLNQYPVLQNDFDNIIQELSNQNIPAVTARIKKLK